MHEIQQFFIGLLRVGLKNLLHLHHDLRERLTGTFISVHRKIEAFRDKGIGLKKRKKSFGETKNWITFAELSPEKIRVNVEQSKSIRTPRVH